MWHWTDPRTRNTQGALPNGQNRQRSPAGPQTPPNPAQPQKHPTHIPTPVATPYANNNLLPPQQQQANWDSRDWSAPSPSPPAPSIATQPPVMNPYFRTTANPYLR